MVDDWKRDAFAYRARFPDLATRDYEEIRQQVTQAVLAGD
jgi:hypothetical protein